MAQVTPYMGLTAWDLETDPYDHNQLVNNWNAVDAHNHTPGKGAPLPPEAIPIIEQGGLGICSVTTPNICDGAVTTGKLAVDSVTNSRIKNDSVGNSKLTDNSVNQAKLTTGAVGEGEIQGGAVTSPKIQDGAVINQKIRDGAVTSAKIGIGQVGPWQLASNSVDNRVLTVDAVVNENMATNSVSNANIQDNAVSEQKLFPIPATCLAKQNKVQIPTGSWQFINWDVVRYNNPWYPNMRLSYSTCCIYPQIPGIYAFTFNVMWDDGNVNDQDGIRRCRIVKNGTIHGGAGPSRVFDDGEGGVFRCRQNISIVVNCYPGDYVGPQVFQNSGRNQWLGPDGLSTNFSGAYLGSLG